MSYRLIDANNIAFNSDGFITAENIVKMPCIYADLPNGMDGEHYVLEQEPKIGHWINIGSEGEIDGQIVQSFSCSECGAISIFRIGYKRPINSDLCPNCGCRMVEPQEREE